MKISKSIGKFTGNRQNNYTVMGKCIKKIRPIISLLSNIQSTL